MKVKKRLRNCSRLKETRDVTTTQYVVSVQILLLQGHYWDNRQNLNGVQELDVSVLFPDFFGSTVVI